jgi:hypothetical protein
MVGSSFYGHFNSNHNGALMPVEKLSTALYRRSEVTNVPHAFLL